MSRRLAALLATALLAGCASLTAPTAPPSTGAEVASCTTWFQRLDGVIDAHQVRDVEADRIAGFNGLRVDRLAASLRDRAQADPAAFDAWLGRLRTLEAEGRMVEIANLPARAFPIDQARNAAEALDQTRRCIEAWREPLQHDDALRQALLARADVPDRYATWKRVVGLYALVRWPFHAAVQGWEREHRALIAQWAASPLPTQRYVAAGPPLSSAHMERLWRNRPRDALGLPLFSADEAHLLLAANAPALEIETRGEFDRIGPLIWRDAAVPRVDTGVPVVYQRLATTRYRGQLLLQLVYSLWFPERPARGRLDLLAGALDAVVLRITLAPDDGRPLIVDTIHGCGCYQQFIPTAELRLRDGAPRNVEWAFSAIELPALHSGQRIVVRLNSASHYVVGSAPDSGAAGITYTLRDEQELRSLPLPQGGTRSVFDADGLVAGSERAERLLFWPMGIESAGAMRQWGHHATAFVGRRHFDDADLIERRFTIPGLE